MSDDAPTKTTGLTGLPKTVEALGMAGTMLVFMGYMLWHNLETIPAAIKDLKIGNEETRDFYHSQLEKERERSEKNRTHGEEQIKAAYTRSRENTKELADRIKENGQTQSKQAELLGEIKVLLSKDASKKP